MVGRRLAHYEIRESLGSGGMGEVYVARDTKLERDVALKVLPTELAENAERLARFEREAKAVAALNHPNIVHVHSVEETRAETGSGPVVAPLPDREATWSEAEQLTADQAFLEYLDVSRDGKKVAFSSDRSGNHDLWILPTEGGEPQQLTTDPTPDWAPAWSPDGTEIAFYAYRGGNRNIWVMPVGAGAAHQLTHDPGSEYGPRWSSDGETIFCWGGGVFSVPSDGGESHRLVERASGVDASLDGRWIAYGDEQAMWIARPDGSDPRILVDRGVQEARFSPDGEHLYYIAGELDTLWSVSVEDGSTRRLTDFGGQRGRLGSLALATDGSYLYFTWCQNAGDLWVMDVVQE